MSRFDFHLPVAITSEVLIRDQCSRECAQLGKRSLWLPRYWPAIVFLDESTMHTSTDWQRLDLVMESAPIATYKIDKTPRKKHKDIPSALSSSIMYIPRFPNVLALPALSHVIGKSSVFLLFLNRFRMTCCEARHWISVLHSDWTKKGPTPF